MDRVKAVISKQGESGTFTPSADEHKINVGKYFIATHLFMQPAIDIHIMYYALPTILAIGFCDLDQKGAARLPIRIRGHGANFARNGIGQPM